MQQITFSSFTYSVKYAERNGLFTIFRRLRKLFGVVFFYFPIFPPLNKFIHFPNWANDCVHFGLAVLFHFINLALLTTVTAEKTSFRAKKGERLKMPPWEKKKFLWDGDPVYVRRLGVQRSPCCVREIRILFLRVKYLEFSYLKQISLTGYFRCLSEPSSKNLRSKHSRLWYKMMSAFHFSTGAWFIWGIVSKPREQTLKDHLTFLISSLFPPLVLKTAPRGKHQTLQLPCNKNGSIAT